MQAATAYPFVMTPRLSRPQVKAQLGGLSKETVVAKGRKDSQTIDQASGGCGALCTLQLCYAVRRRFASQGSMKAAKGHCFCFMARTDWDWRKGASANPVGEVKEAFPPSANCAGA